ncbi:unnamed protein product [Cunninghamella echinulata]
MNESISLLGKKDDNNKLKRIQKKKFIGIIVILVTGIVLTLIFFFVPNRKIYGKKGGVAVEAEECSKVGVKILQKGGNAVDAAIASTLCIGVIDNFATGNIYYKCK